jgi:hypothetical protein
MANTHDTALTSRVQGRHDAPLASASSSRLASPLPTPLYRGDIAAKHCATLPPHRQKSNQLSHPLCLALLYMPHHVVEPYEHQVEHKNSFCAIAMPGAPLSSCSVEGRPMPSSSMPLCACSLLLVSCRSFRSAWFHCYRVGSAGTSRYFGRASHCRRRTELRFIMFACPSVELVGVP